MFLSADDDILDEVEQAAREYVSDDSRMTRQFKAKWLDIDDVDARQVGAALAELAEQEGGVIEPSNRSFNNTQKWRYTGDLSKGNE